MFIHICLYLPQETLEGHVRSFCVLMGRTGEEVDGLGCKVRILTAEL